MRSEPSRGCAGGTPAPPIDHARLLAEIEHRVADEGALWLCRAIVEGSVLAWFPSDGLFAPAERRRGLPIGNLSSQFFANLFLDPIDHLVKDTLRTPGYARYVDLCRAAHKSS